MKEEHKTNNDDLLTLLVVLIWGVNFPILKQALAVMHPFALNVFRFIVSTFALWSMMAIRSGNFRLFAWDEIKPHIKTVVGLGMLGYFFYQVMFILGIERTTAGNSALIMSSTPVWTALTGILFGIEQLRRQAWIGLSISMAGTLMIVVYGNETIDLGGDFFIGNLLTLLAAIMWGSYTALTRPVTKKVDSSTLVITGLLCAFPFNLLIAIPYFEQIDWSIVTFSVWAAIIYSGGLSTGIAVAIWIIVVQRVGATHTAVFGNLVPLIAILGAFIILGEIITLPQIIGGGFIVGGLLILRNDRFKP